MNAAAAIQLIQALDALTTVAINLGVNVAKYNEMRAQGPITADQLKALARDLDRNLAKL